MKIAWITLLIGGIFLTGCLHPPITLRTYSGTETGANERVQRISELKKNAQKPGAVIPNSVGVLPFREVGSQTGLGFAATEFLTSNLSLFDRFTLIDQSYSDVLEEEFATYSPQQKRTMLRAEQLLEGSVRVEQGKLTIEGRLYYGNRSQPQVLGKLNGETRDFFRLVADLNIQFLQANHITVTPEIARELYQVPTEDLVAYILYARGRHYERLGNYTEALKAYRAAVKRDPKFKQAQQQLRHMEQSRPGAPVVSSTPETPDELTNVSTNQTPNIIQEVSVPSVSGNAPVLIEVQLPVK